ncbi:hypothetical protein B0H21DRAFT_331819 [Amylocystis lapponica]|nr:hypothetical protein B0H21DRAFT_331819 [Amylocystis lapponica]
MSAIPTPFHVRTNTSRAHSPLVTGYKPSLPITIPRRENARPPPRSPLRPLPSPDLVFNFDFSPCSVKDLSTQAWLQQCRPTTFARSPTGYAPFAIEPDVRAYMRSPGVGPESELLPYDDEPVLCSVPRTLEQSTRHTRLRTHSSPVPGSARVISAIDENGNVGTDRDFEQVVSASAVSSILYPSCSSLGSSALVQLVHTSGGAYGPVTQKCGPENSEDADVLIAAFQQSLVSSTSGSASASTSVSTYSQFSPPASPSSPVTVLPLSPVSQPTRRPTNSCWRSGLGTALAKQAHVHLASSAAAPVVSFKVAQAERATCGSKAGWLPTFYDTPRVTARGRSPYPSMSSRARRNSSTSIGASRGVGTVVGAGRAANMRAGRVMSVVMSDEDLERSLEKEEREEWPKRGRFDEDVDAAFAQWEERGRPRGRTMARGR